MTDQPSKHWHPLANGHNHNEWALAEELLVRYRGGLWRVTHACSAGGIALYRLTHMFGPREAPDPVGGPFNEFDYVTELEVIAMAASDRA